MNDREKEENKKNKHSVILCERCASISLTIRVTLRLSLLRCNLMVVVVNRACRAIKVESNRSIEYLTIILRLFYVDRTIRSN